ncbi:hypothetical protein E2C01_024966 [Portunus trituberculatus]|uniref:Uncharacterized protein n=1 Tax=Portunus trituberculatus TaxID=210409 RepID=A0A5B7EBT8_PORTR|nr:hypothetical protein [Portunus trituberculatus]
MQGQLAGGGEVSQAPPPHSYLSNIRFPWHYFRGRGTCFTVSSVTPSPLYLTRGLREISQGEQNIKEKIHLKCWFP